MINLLLITLGWMTHCALCLGNHAQWCMHCILKIYIQIVNLQGCCAFFIHIGHKKPSHSSAPLSGLEAWKCKECVSVRARCSWLMSKGPSDQAKENQSTFKETLSWTHTTVTLCVGSNAHTHLIEYKTFPFLKILRSLLSVVTSWKCAPFSLAKNRSGFHMESNMDGSRSRESSGYSA